MLQAAATDPATSFSLLQIQRRNAPGSPIRTTSASYSSMRLITEVICTSRERARTILETPWELCVVVAKRKQLLCLRQTVRSCACPAFESIGAAVLQSRARAAVFMLESRI